MTELELRNHVVATAEKWLGCKESDGTHKPIIDLYNSHKPLARGYAVTYTDAWCATYVSAVAIACGLTDIKIGGYASCGFYEILNTQAAGQAHVSTRTGYFIEFFEKFLAHITSEGHRAPLDFFSWHSYSGTAENIRYAAYAREMLDKFGFTETESILNEWNPGIHRRGTLADAAHIGSMMVAMQNAPVDLLMYYDGTLESSYGGMFNPLTRTPFKAYHAFRGFNELYKLGTQYPIEGAAPDGQIGGGLYALAAGDETATHRALLLFNTGDTATLTAPDGEWEVYLLDEDHDLEPVGKVKGGETLHVPAEGGMMLKSV